VDVVLSRTKSVSRSHSLATRLFLAALFAVLFCLMPTTANAQVSVQSTNTATAAIPESTSCATTLTRTFSVTPSFTIGDVNIGVLLAHGTRGNLRLSLQSPGGTTVNLMTNVGGTLDNLSVRFDDAAANPISAHTGSNDSATTAYQRTFRPAAALTGFNGQNSAGTWTLTICDSVAGTTGNFVRADLFVAQQNADLSLSKTVSNATPTTGSSISYTLTVINAGTSPNTATGITVRDILPAGVSFVSAAGTGTYSSGTGVWNVGTLAPGTSASITLNVTVTISVGTVNNTAEITASSFPDPDSTVNNGSTTEDDDANAAFAVYRAAGIAPTISCPVGNTIFDWGVNTWTAGSLNNTYNLTGVGDFTIAMSSVTPYVTGSPAINGNLTGGVTGEVSLFQNLNNDSISDTATTVITMPGGLPGIQFRLFDVDFGVDSYSDKVVVTGSYQGSPVIPVLTNGNANYVVGNTVIGDMSAADDSNAANVVVTFNAPIDTVTVVYGNHTTAPANPGNQWIGLGDITFCNPYGSFVSTIKLSEVVSDGVSATNPKAIPGATVRYCITFGNNGTATVTGFTASDPMPANMTVVPGTMRTGATCGTATAVEDENGTGADENDPFGMNFGANTVTGVAATLAAGTSFAMTFNATIN
jgi:uncharacterized repeat protein (TIGR01451 family)